MKRNPVKEEARDCIATALVGLSLKKPLSSITVTELCKSAGVSRMAFYRNFDSKEEVFSWKLESLVDDYEAATSLVRAKGSPWFSLEHLYVCFLFLKENSDFIDGLYRCGYAQLLVDAIAGYTIKIWGNETPEGEYILTAFAGSVCASYSRWREQDFPESPKQMAAILGRFYTALPTPREQGT